MKLKGWTQGDERHAARHRAEYDRYRPYFIAGAVGLLGFGFYMVYSPNSVCEPGSGGATPSRRLKIFNRVMLWTAAALVGAFVMFPNYVGLVLGTPTKALHVNHATDLASAEFKTAGMTCEGCSSMLHEALMNLPHAKAAEVVFSAKPAVVRFESGKPVCPSRVIDAVKAAGYSATPARRPQRNVMFGPPKDHREPQTDAPIYP